MVEQGCGTLSLGIDCGTSALKAMVIDAQGQIHHADRIPLRDPADPYQWRAALEQVLQTIPPALKPRIDHIAIAGTSGTVLLVDDRGEPVAPVLLYNDARAVVCLEELQRYVPAPHLVLSATSSLAKVFWYARQGLELRGLYLLHQADWLGFWLHGQLGVSDAHNALKLGYDPGARRYPDWFADLPVPVRFPQVLIPGAVVGALRPEVAPRFGLPPACSVHAGTTDSIAAFIASGANQVGDGVTSLGSTLALKLLSDRRIDDPTTGVYSHRLGDLWLVGGASNTGGAVLSHFFSAQELEDLSARINPLVPLDLGYYPLLKPGERFPICDPHLAPRLDPRPDDPVQFLQALLTAMARIEAEGYRLLQTLGGPALQRVFTSGGGSRNPTWQAIRQQLLGVPVLVAQQQEAAWGTARLAQGLPDRLNAEINC
ncbi:MAG: FGGY-family carbohydrate kinase [Gloeomargarita sp. SKYBB_i_bin120]|nr:FGGY-family carbohydrate kinase [Gloeomargarita sp. SKYB120]MDW8177213.1 FGGY-family carbohydrate kinase [Gloeomargarita sp. SKYBB_i_bin120]